MMELENGTSVERKDAATAGEKAEGLCTGGFPLLAGSDPPLIPPQNLSKALFDCILLCHLEQVNCEQGYVGVSAPSLALEVD